MKHNRLFRILAMAVVLSLLMIAIPATPALAATLTLTPASGPVGQAITVTGTGFTVGTGYVWFDTNNNDVRDSGEPQVQVTVAVDTIPAGVTLTVPGVARASYDVWADIPTGGSAEAVATFTVTPQITALTTSPFHVGDTVTVTGNGFAASSTSIIIYFDGTTNVDTATTNSAGVLSGASFIVPECTQGNHTVKGTDASGSSPNFTFTVSPKITISPTSGAVGDTVTISGTGFAASSSTTVYLDSTSVGLTFSTTANGSFSSKTFTVPATSRGSHTVKAQDASSNQATATFTVSTKITINPTSGPSGTTVTVTGTGFAVGQTVTITYAGTSVVTTPSPVTTGSTGGFTATFVVPVRDIGTYEVRASAGSDTATANFQSTTDATISPVTSASSPGYVGEEITITGVGFTPNATITITYASEVIFEDTITSLADGSFSYILTVPPSIAGPHVITVSDTVITKTFDFIMESNPPPIPALVLPLVDTKLKDGTFDWGEVTDPEPSNPVTYSLQVAIDADFTTPLVDKTGLTTSAYTLLDEEKLESTGKDEPYYWHVRAVDAASNASAWSEASTFTVGFSFEFTGWVMWVIMGAIALVFFIFGVWIGKRSGGGYY